MKELEILPPNLTLEDLTAMKAFAEKVASLTQSGDMIGLSGELGAGKTAFARAFLRSIGVDEDVPSPTFTLVQGYDTTLGLVNHFDLYRLQSPRDLDELGFDDALADGIALVEWPERLGGFAHEQRLDIRFTVIQNNHRAVALRGRGHWAENLQGPAAP